MGKWIAGVIFAFVLGGACTYAAFMFVPENTALGPPDRPAADQPPAGAGANLPAAELALTTLADIAGLPSHFEQTAVLYNLLRRAEPPTLERLLGEANDLRPPSESHAAKAIIYARYAEVDPLAAVDRALEEKGPVALSLLTHVFTAWAKQDFDAALAHAETLPSNLRASAATGVLQTSDGLPPDQRSAVAGAFPLEQQLALVDSTGQLEDPALAWQAALAEAAGPARMMKLRQIAEHWVLVDPLGALAAAAELPGSGMFGDLRPFLVQRWAELDGEAARAWVLGQPDSPARRDMLGTLARAIAARDPQSALALARTLEGVDRRQVLEAALTAWAQTDALAALAALEELRDEGVPQGAQFGIVAGWAQQDPRAAFEWAVAQKITMENFPLAIIPLQLMAQSDPKEALRLAEQLEGMRRQHAIGAVVGAWADTDPRAAAAWLESAEGDLSSAVGAVAYSYSQASPAEAFDWLQALPKENQFLAVHSWASAAAQWSPDEASGMIADIDDAELRTQATQAFVGAWAQSAPGDAARWIRSSPDTEARPSLYRGLFQSWGHFDRDGAAEELRRIDRRERDMAALGLIESTAYNDADFAAKIYGRIRNDEAKREAAGLLYHSLMQIDPDRAERYRAAAGVAEE